jgi:hypothetical protein
MQTLGANEPMPLPTFQVMALDGRVVESASLPSDERWLVLYVQPNCSACAALLDLATKPESRIAAARVVVLVAAESADDVRALAARYPDLGGARWYWDAGKHAFTALNLTGAPVIMGLQLATVKWCFTGISRDTAKMTSLLQDWMGG